MNVLVTGGCGFIGVNLIAELLRRGYPQIAILDNLKTGSIQLLAEAVKEPGGVVTEGGESPQPPLHHRTVNVHVGDIRDVTACLQTTRGKDVVVHLAANTGVVDSVRDPISDFEANVRGTVQMLKACVDNHVGLFVFASSGAPLGGQMVSATEDLPLHPASPYGASKAAGEAYCAAFYRAYGLATVAVRFSNVYGPYCSHKQNVVATFLSRALRGEPLIVYGDGSQTRDFLYAKDLCQGMVHLLDRHQDDRLGPLLGRVVQLGSGRETRISDLTQAIKHLVEPDLGKPLTILHEPPRVGEVARSAFVITRARQLLGYEPQTRLQSGLEEVWRWLQAREARPS